VAILVAVLASVLFGFAAIVVDLGYARTVEGDAQSAVDAASLAGAGILADDSSPSAITRAYAAIKASAAANFGTTSSDWDACSAARPSARWVPAPGGTDCILFNNNANNPSKLQVVLPARHVDSFFGGLFGYGGMDINVRAQATIRGDDVPGCALCVQELLDTSGDVSVDGGSTGGSSSADTGHVGTGGHITVQDPGAITFAKTPDPAKGPMYSPRPIIRPVTDPFAGRPEPAGPGSFPDGWPIRNVKCGPDEDVQSLGPGVYRNITITGPCDATGVIVVTGPFIGLHITSGGSLSAVSAAIQFSCGSRAAPTICAGTGGGRLQIDAGGQLSMIASLPPDFSVVADPGNTAAMTIDGEVSVDSAIYGRLAAVDVGWSATVSAAGQISVKQLTVAFGAAVHVNAPGAAPLPGPPFVGLYR
jgi:hypothetical protein